MKVSWDDEIPNIWNNKIHVPNHQPLGKNHHVGDETNHVQAASAVFATFFHQAKSSLLGSAVHRRGKMGKGSQLGDL
jgi:hypothetical protein